jgi:hypothetical protein
MLEQFKAIRSEKIPYAEVLELGQPENSVILSYKVFKALLERIEALEVILKVKE